MEEKLKRLKEFNSKPKRPSQRKECKWCKEKILKGSSICPSCQQPQKKRHWLLAHPSVAVSAISLAIAFGSFKVAWEANNPPPAAPKVGAYVHEYDDKKFRFTVYNYGDAPTFLTALELKVSLIQKDTTHVAHSYYLLNDKPIFLPVGSSPETLAINYSNQEAGYSKWETRGGQEVFGLSFLYMASSLGSNLDCEIRLWYSASGTANNRTSSTSMSNGNCVSAMEWMSQEFGPLKNNPLSDFVLRYRATHEAENSQHETPE